MRCIYSIRPPIDSRYPNEHEREQYVDMVVNQHSFLKYLDEKLVQFSVQLRETWNCQ